MNKWVWATLFFAVSFFAFAGGDDLALFREAEKEYRAGNYDLASRAYKSLVSEYPLSDYIADAQFRRAVCYYKLGDLSASLRLFYRVNERYQSSRFFDYLDFWLALNNYSLNNYEKAIEYFDSYLDKGLDRFLKEALLYKAFCEYRLGLDEEALKTSLRLSDIGVNLSDEASALSMIFSLYLRSDNYDKIVALYRSLDLTLIKEPFKDEIELYAGEAYFFIEDYDFAEPIYNRLVYSKNSKIAATSLQRLFSIYRSQKRYNKMGALLKDAEENFKGNFDVLNALYIKYGVEKFKLKRYDDAISYFSKIWKSVNIENQKDLVVLYYSDCFAKKGDFRRAESILYQYRKFAKEYKDRVLLKNAYYALLLEDYKKCRLLAEEFISLSDKSSVVFDGIDDAFYLSIFADYKMANYKRAANKIEKLEESNPDFLKNENFINLKVNVYDALGDYVKSVSSLERYILSSPDDDRAWMNVLKQNFKIKNYNKVVEFSNKLNSDKPRLKFDNYNLFVFSHYLKALSFIALKDYSRAERTLSKIDIDKIDDEVFSSLKPYIIYYKAWVFYRQEKFSLADEFFSEYLNLYPSGAFSKKIRYYIAWSRYSMNEYARARESFKEYADFSGGVEKEKGLLMAGKCFVLEKKFEEAHKEFISIINNKKSVLADDALFENGLLYRLEGENRLAADEFLKLIENYKDSDLEKDALFLGSDLYFGIGDYENSALLMDRYINKYSKELNIDSAMYKSATSYYNLKSYDRAIDILEKALNVYPQTIYRSDISLLLADCYMEIKDWAKAEFYYNQFKSESDLEKNPRVERALAKLFFLNLGYDEDDASFSAEARISGGIKTAKGRIAILKSARKNIYSDYKPAEDKALYDVDKIINDYSKDKEAYAFANFIKGEYFYKKANYKSASIFYYEAIINFKDNNPLLPEALYKAGKTSSLDKRYDDANILLTRVIENYPKSSWAEKSKIVLKRIGK